MKCTSHETLGLPPGDQVSLWRDATGRYFGPLEAQALSDAPFDARLTVCAAGPLRLFTIEAPAHRVACEGASADVQRDTFKLLLQLEGRSEIRQHDAVFDLRPGDWSLYDPRVPYAITSRESIRQMAVQIPRAKLGHLPLGSLHTCEAHTPELRALYQVLSSFLGALAVQLRSLPDTVGTPLSETTLGLLAQALQAQRGEAPCRTPLPEVLRARVRHYIQAHLADADLGVERIAHELRCSKRYLHRLFETEERTLDRHIWLARLERCRQALFAADAATVSISAVAYRWGFNSNAHFCRLFRREFGMTPSEFLRRRAH